MIASSIHHAHVALNGAARIGVLEKAATSRYELPERLFRARIPSFGGWAQGPQGRRFAFPVRQPAFSRHPIGVVVATSPRREGKRTMQDEITKSDEARFWSRVEVFSDDRCWIWNGSLPRGADSYGRFNGEPAHRFAYRLFHGQIADGLVIRHKCDNRRCVNPHHLETGTHADNMADAVERKRMASGARHPKTKLTAEQVAEIRESSERGIELARRFGVSESTISYIRSGRSWKAAA